MYRSMLYVPASSPRFIEKAGTRGADAIILDLEDSVAEEQKAAARKRLAEAVPFLSRSGTDVWVRVNRPLTLAVADVQAATCAGAIGILLAKTEGPEHVRLIAEVADEEERHIGRVDGLKIIAVIETPAAVFRAREIAASDKRVIGMLAGAEDLATCMEAMPSAETLRMPKLLIHLAAKAADRFSFGTLGTVADFADIGLIQKLAEEARRHGFDGATCIHPSVVPVLNQAFTPSQSDIDNASGIIAAAKEAHAAGAGATTYKGKMIDEPVVERAKRLVARANFYRGTAS
jgi:citrate lyase subunit beta/citryl-CoA lyase